MPLTMVKQWFVLLMALVLAACSTNPVKEPMPKPTVITDNHLYRSQFGPRPQLPNPATLHTLSAAQQLEFNQFLESRRSRQVSAHRAVYEYLLSLLDGFGYTGQTLSASDALVQRSGDCLSLAILTTALADLSGLDIKYQLVDDLPVFELHGSLVEKGLHIRTILYEPSTVASENNELRLFRSGIKIDYFPSGNERFVSNLTRDEYLSTYYQNMAATALKENDLNLAYWNTVESLKLAPDNSAALNNLAIVYRRSGDEEHAETIYQYGISQSSNKLTLLKNYQTLLQAQDRFDEARAISKRLEQMNDPSPHHWYLLARHANQLNLHTDAIKYFKAAIERAPYVPQLHLELAQTHYKKGDIRAAKNAMAAAVNLSARESERVRYAAKLAALNKLHDDHFTR